MIEQLKTDYPIQVICEVIGYSRLMRELGLLAKRRIRRKRTTNSVHGYKRYPNLVQGLVVERPEQVWVGDITDIRLKDEFVYLAV